MSRRTLVTLVQLLISVVLLVMLTRRVPWAETWGFVQRVPTMTVVVAVALAMVGYRGRAFRWSALLGRAGVVLPSAKSYVLTLVGTGYGLLTPGRVGEFARALHLRGARAAAAPSVVWDRITDVLLLELMAGPAFLLIPEWRARLLPAYLLVTGLTIAVVALIDRPSLLDPLFRRVPSLERLTRAWRTQSSGMLGSAAFRSGLLGGSFFYVFSYLSGYLLVRAIAPEAPARLLLTLPVIPFLGNLPFAFGGLGLRESVSASVFAQMGAEEAAGLAFSLLWFGTNTLVPGLVGLALAPTPWAHVDATATDHQGPATR